LQKNNTQVHQTPCFNSYFWSKGYRLSEFSRLWNHAKSTHSWR